MPKWRLVISGKVQIAGYRAMIKNIAIGLQVKGIARNLDDGAVEIYCEASPDSFDKFKSAINFKGEPSNMFAPSVEKILVYKEKSREYGKAPKGFKGFKIDYSGVDPQIENLERSEMGIVALGVVGSNIKAMHGDMNKRFDTLDTKYGQISKQMTRLVDHMVGDEPKPKRRKSARKLAE